MLNPYAQSGWNNKQSSHQPSILGALPYTIPPSDPHIVSFVFTFEEDVLNSIVLGPKGVHYYTISTDFRRPSVQTTAIQNVSSKSMGRVDWNIHSSVEWATMIPRQKTKDFLRLGSDGMSRVMEFSNQVLEWTPNQNYISLYSGGKRDDANMLARACRTDKKTIVLEVTTQALRSGILDYAVLSAVLLQSGRSID